MKYLLALALLILTFASIHLMNGLPQNNPSILGDQTAIFSQPTPVKTSMLPLEFQQEINSNPQAFIIDIREPHEIAQGKIQGALELDFYSPEFAQQLSKLDKDKNYYIYCNSGNRTSQTLPLMQSLGFTNVSQLQTGIQGWYQHSLQTCTNC